MKFLIGSYVLLLGVLAIYSYGFVDPNLTLTTNALYQKLQEPLRELVFDRRQLATIAFITIVFLLFTIYFLILRLLIKKKFGINQLKLLIVLNVGVLVFSYPAFSYDIFNYILTAKVTFLYKENPYIVMPIEILGDPNLAFTRAANKIALYGPSWIGLTVIPHIIGLGNIVPTIFSFKLFVAVFYLGAVWVIWKMSKNLLSIALFAFNPLVVIETLVSAHNDIVMMFFALLAFYLLQKKKIIMACFSFIASILIKYATLFLFPVFLYVIYLTLKKKKIDWEKVYAVAAFSMFLVFATSPLREEIYSWYVIWILSFAVLVHKQKFLLSIAIVLSFATLLRYTPVFYTGSYFGITPIVKELVTFVPISLVAIFWIWKKLTLRNI